MLILTFNRQVQRRFNQGLCNYQSNLDSDDEMPIGDNSYILFEDFQRRTAKSFSNSIKDLFAEQLRQIPGVSAAVVKTLLETMNPNVTEKPTVDDHLIEDLISSNVDNQENIQNVILLKKINKNKAKALLLEQQNNSIAEILHSYPPTIRGFVSALKQIGESSAKVIIFFIDINLFFIL